MRNKFHFSPFISLLPVIVFPLVEPRLAHLLGLLQFRSPHPLLCLRLFPSLHRAPVPVLVSPFFLPRAPPLSRLMSSTVFPFSAAPFSLLFLPLFPSSAPLVRLSLIWLSFFVFPFAPFSLVASPLQVSARRDWRRIVPSCFSVLQRFTFRPAPPY